MDYPFKKYLLSSMSSLYSYQVCQHLSQFIHKKYILSGGEWSSPSIAGQERENERVSLGRENVI